MKTIKLIIKTSVMKAIKFSIFAIIICGLNFTYSQNVKFVKKYSFPGMNGGLGACKTSDGGIAITGQHEYGAGVGTGGGSMEKTSSNWNDLQGAVYCNV